MLDDSTDKFLTYRFTVVPFGSSSSPFMLAAVLDLHLSKVTSPVAADMKENIYVDNILVTAPKCRRNVIAQALVRELLVRITTFNIDTITARDIHNNRITHTRVLTRLHNCTKYSFVVLDNILLSKLFYY